MCLSWSFSWLRACATLSSSLLQNNKKILLLVDDLIMVKNEQVLNYNVDKYAAKRQLARHSKKFLLLSSQLFRTHFFTLAFGIELPEFLHISSAAHVCFSEFFKQLPLTANIHSYLSAAKTTIVAKRIFALCCHQLNVKLNVTFVANTLCCCSVAANF